MNVLEKLEQLLNNSYSPYSKFPVSAIVQMKDDNYFCGVNVENASYGATICAERSAIINAISNGYQKDDFKRIYIMNKTTDIITPCMLCRSFFVEFFNMDVEVVLYSIDKKSTTYLVKDLCPYPFTKEDLL